MHIGMVAGEPSGDLLASRLLQGLRAQQPALRCTGIGGPQMQAQGFDAWHPMAALSVFGYVDALKALPRLYRSFHDVKRRYLRNPPQVFVGVDAPDFNLRLEVHLRRAGVPTIHFVGPSIWAWRYERIHRIREAVSHMLVLFPFEEQIYRDEGIPVTCVGHPLASVIPMETDQAHAREALGLDPQARVLALMPGSRASEIRLLAPRFLQAVQRLQAQDPDLHCLVPMVNRERRMEFEACLAAHPVQNLRIILQSTPAGLSRPAAWSVLAASDAALVASGTATLEAALFKRPMVISYVLSPWMRRIMAWRSGQERPLVPWVGLPNVLAQTFIVPELLQDEATPEGLAEASWRALTDEAHRREVTAQYSRLHADLQRDTVGLANRVILAHAD
ncbi:MAG: lipid-A-disaccharide synthase [Castellaniella sp.]